MTALPAQSSLTSLTAGMRASLGRRSSTRCSGILDDVRTSSRIPEHLVELLLPRLALMPAVRLVKELCAGRAVTGQERRPVTKACCQMSSHDLNGQCHHTFFFTGRPPWLPGASWSKVTFVWPPAFLPVRGTPKRDSFGKKNWDWEVSRNSNVLLQKQVLKESKGRFLRYNSPLCN